MFNPITIHTGVDKQVESKVHHETNIFYVYIITLILFKKTNQSYKEHCFIASISQNGTFYLIIMINILVKNLSVGAGAVFPKFRSCQKWNPKTAVSDLVLEAHPTLHLAIVGIQVREEIVPLLPQSCSVRL